MHLLGLEAETREAVLALLVRYAGLCAEQVVNPGAVGLELRTITGEDRRQVQPRRGIANGANLIRYAGACKVAHLVVELFVGPELEQVTRNSLCVVDLDEETVLAMLYLQRNASSLRGNDGTSVVDGLMGGQTLE